MIRPAFLLTLFAAFSLFGVADAEAKRWKRKRKGPPPAGWVAGEEDATACYHPPPWDTLNEMDRRMKRAEVLDEFLNQWRGQRNDGVSFDERVIEEVETVLLGRPVKIEAVLTENLAQCLAGDRTAWQSWAKALPAKLTAGECNTPLDYTMFDYLDIGVGWQRPLSICQDNRIRISGTVNDRYRIEDSGPWINVDGDPAKPTLGTDAPCNLEGCKAGMLIMKFKSKSGVETIIPVGTRTVFSAPEDGEISYRINDTVFFDNVWHQSGGLIDHTAIEVSPAR